MKQKTEPMIIQAIPSKTALNLLGIGLEIPLESSPAAFYLRTELRFWKAFAGVTIIILLSKQNAAH